jgi:cytochrome P450
MAEPLVIDFDHHSKDFLDHRHAAWAKVRETPVAFTPNHGGFWVVSGHAEVAQVSRDEATFTSEYGPRGGVDCKGIIGVPRSRGIPPAGIAEAPGELHQILRRVLNPYLLPPAVEDMRPFAEALTHWFLDQHIEAGRMDLVQDLTNPVPAVITMRLIGLPCEEWDHYAELFHATVAHQPGGPEYTRAVARVPEMLATLMKEVLERRAAPRDDLLTALVELRTDDGEPVGDEAIGSILWNLVGGGLDTTTSLTSLSLYHLATHPDLRRRLIAEPELLPTATEEFLRYFSVNETLTRTVTRDTELGGQHLSAGDVVLISWLTANHDESVFEQPGDVVMDRSPNRHLAFGIGPHRCIGMHVARSLFETMVAAVLERIPDFEVDRDRTRFYEGNPMMAGVVTMPVTFTPGPKTGPAVQPF